MLTLGIDEVGRGAWAGPLTVGAVVFDSDSTPTGLADSKKLTKKQRRMLSLEIKKTAVAIGVGWVSAARLDELGLSEALKLATQRAIRQIPREIFDQVDQIIIDGTVNFLAGPGPAMNKVTTLPKADSKIAAVSAAAIVAKVSRDAYMTQLEHVFPHYSFARHVGYGTTFHQEKLHDFGVIDGIHRQSFAPIQEVTRGAATLATPKSPCETVRSYDEERANFPVTTGEIRVLPQDDLAKRRLLRGTAGYYSGHSAENVAADYLEKLGHQIIAQNWKTKFCEIDIISEYRKTLYFTEVKYRANARHGDGLAAITPKKLRKMRFAVDFYLLKNADLVKDFDIKIAVISLSQTPPQVDEFIENVI
ncbi:ribonuclease HII [Candidatus Saccharibacteria bacterium]|nr:ribonuclease HII [Candidatus Saccharibacteria bacterium]